MKKLLFLGVICTSLMFPKLSVAQDFEDQMGAWYMYFFSKKSNNTNWGFQGDIQYRNWDYGGDLEQLLLRAGVSYDLKRTGSRITFGYGNITSGEFGDGNSTSGESRIYQELLHPYTLGDRFFFTHRLRFEQRWVQNQDPRTRYRYALFLNVPLNSLVMGKDVLYLSFYDELFINGQREIGGGRKVNIFDRNRAYAALGYQFASNMKVQLGIMQQALPNTAKNQIQLSLHHSF